MSKPPRGAIVLLLINQDVCLLFLDGFERARRRHRRVVENTVATVWRAHRAHVVALSGAATYMCHHSAQAIPARSKELQPLRVKHHSSVFVSRRQVPHHVSNKDRRLHLQERLPQKATAAHATCPSVRANGIHTVFGMIGCPQRLQTERSRATHEVKAQLHREARHKVVSRVPTPSAQGPLSRHSLQDLLQHRAAFQERECPKMRQSPFLPLSICPYRLGKEKVQEFLRVALPTAPKFFVQSARHPMLASHMRFENEKEARARTGRRTKRVQP